MTFYSLCGIGTEVFDAWLGRWILGYNLQHLGTLGKVLRESSPLKYNIIMHHNSIWPFCGLCSSCASITGLCSRCSQMVFSVQFATLLLTLMETTMLAVGVAVTELLDEMQLSWQLRLSTCARQGNL